MTAMTNVDIVDVFFDVGPGSSVVLLGQGDRPARVLPIMVGSAEADAIARAVAGIVPPRPGTHDLMQSLLGLLDAKLEAVAITELRDGTFFAELFVESACGLEVVDARPSDCLALAVRSGVPIVVTTTLFEKAAVPVRHEADEPITDTEVEVIVTDFREFLATVSPQDFSDEET